MNHVFVDFENVSQVDLSLIGAKAVSFTLMVGPKQTKLNAGLVEKLMEHSLSVRLVRLKSSAKNAVDFALAYYLGRAVLEDPSGSFHILAKDAGYDPLIAHLRERHVKVCRYESCADMTFSSPGNAAAGKSTVPMKAVKKIAAKKAAKKAVVTKKVEVVSLDEVYQRVWDNLQKKSETSRPTRRKTLLATIGNLIREEADSKKVASVVQRLENAGVLAFDEKDHPKYAF